MNTYSLEEEEDDDLCCVVTFDGCCWWRRRKCEGEFEVDGLVGREMSLEMQ